MSSTTANDDGVGVSDEEVRLQQFCDWLRENGAVYPKIKWPSNDTESGSRGAVATEDIESGEHMLEIPACLMMSPPNAFADPEIGEVLRENENKLLHGDLLITVFIMHELRKGERSFYSPFLRILPVPGNVSEWEDEELLQLQDKVLAGRARNRRHNMKTMYNRTILALNKMHPAQFPLEEFTYERFKFSFNSVQARAFGRRLPWTAMVPFADCLNHTNVQTKYDFDVDSNGVFRLFPTGDNHYPRGAEVFNSYGRRPNENLLMDYGFAIFNNEWDDVELCVGVPDGDPHFQLRYHALALVGFQPNRIFRIIPSELPFQALMFLRIAQLDAKILQYVVDTVESQGRTVRGATVGTTTTSREATHRANVEGQAQEEGPVEKAKSVRISEPGEHYDAKYWFSRVFSAVQEVRVLETLRGLLLTLLGQHPTSYSQDRAILARLERMRRGEGEGTPTFSKATADLGTETDDAPAAAEDGSEEGEEQLSAADLARLEALTPDCDAYWRLLNAVTYRLTRKNILIASLRRLDQLLSYFRAIGDVSEADCGGSYGDLWTALVTDDGASISQAGAPRAGFRGAGRSSGYQYVRAYRTYKWDAANPLQWPEFPADLQL